MKIAIPLNDDQLAPHFTKADTIAIFDEQGTELLSHANPALDTNCSGKQRLVDLLTSQQVDRVVIRNIGEQMLGRLLDSGIAVLQASSSRIALGDLISSAAKDLQQLTESSQGRPSVNHEKKMQEGGCGCSHEGHGEHHGHEDKGSCCGGESHSQEEKGSCCQSEKEEKSSCCQSEAPAQQERGGCHGHGHGHQGRGRCCHS